MRPVVYTGVSTALAGGVVAYAFAQRPNFYSACVFLSQSNLSLMILINLCFIVAFSVVWTLSRLLYGRLRPIEVEQLYERGWFAVTETCLAMTIFRNEIGAWFIAMFVALMAGRVWGWIGHGRVEILEQQPPANPRAFHTRLILSLLVSLAYDFAFVSYAANTVYEQARPNMMVMFLFEYVLLTISSISTALRYVIAVVDLRIHQKQTQEMLEIRRAEIRERREEILRQREARAERGEVSTGREEPLPSEDDVEEMDIEPPGWEGKGQMILILDLLSDFMRLVVYFGFFAVLTTFFGLPIHIMHDLFVTARSFIKRLNAMLKYRNATRDMNAKYPDATAEEINDNDTCIICREEMRPWNQPNQDGGRTADGNQPVARPGVPISERLRPKKLPCGHVLHLGCLKSWLERQQFCPTCRAPVSGRTMEQTPAQQAPAQGRAGGPGGQPHPLAGGQPQLGQQPAAANNGIRGGMINLGPLRLAYGRAVVPGNVDPAVAQEAARQAIMSQARVPPGARVLGLELGNVPHPALTPQAGWQAPQATSTVTNTATLDIGELIRCTEQRIMEEASRLELQREDLAVLKRMQQELTRLRTVGRGQRAQHQVAETCTTSAVPTTSGASTANSSTVPPTSTDSLNTASESSVVGTPAGKAEGAAAASNPNEARKDVAAEEQPVISNSTDAEAATAIPNQETATSNESASANNADEAAAPSTDSNASNDRSAT